MRRAPYSIKGREPGFDGADVEEYVAVVKVRLSHKPGSFPATKDDDLACVAERAVFGAAAAYNFHNTRIVSVDLVGITPVERESLPTVEEAQEAYSHGA